MKSNQEIILDGNKYSICQFGRKDGRKVFLRLISLLLPMMIGVMPKLLETLPELQGLSENEQEKEIGKLMKNNKNVNMNDGLLATFMNPSLTDHVDSIVDKLLEKVLFIEEGKPPLEVNKNYDKVMDNMPITHEFLLCLEVVRHNGFFDNLDALKYEAQEMAFNLI